MQFNVSTLLKESVGATRQYEVDEPIVIDDQGHRERVTGSATFLRTNAGVLVTAHLQGNSREKCSRCLRELDYHLSIDVEEEFLQTVDATTGAPLPQLDEPNAFRIDDHHTVDLGEAVRQYWATVLPMQPLCRPDCLGLCPRCGRDLNEGPCGCPSEEADERWAALADLKISQEGS